jgi:uncharacterized membrane protein YdjX (TVP38/TMEM64 family)
LTLTVYLHSAWEIIWLGTATGIGAGIGSTISYGVAHTVVAQVDDLEKSALFRYVKNTIDRHPIAIPIFIFLILGTPMPDFVILVPLALINYSWKNLLIPIIVGKIFQNVIMAFVFKFAADQASHVVSRNINFDITAVVVVLFIIVIAYQVEKARAELSSQPKKINEVTSVN